MMTIIDDFSRKVWVYFLRHKNEVFHTFNKWKTLVEVWKKVKKLRTYNGLEFCGSDFNELCVEHGIARHKTIPGKPQQKELVVCSQMLGYGIDVIFGLRQYLLHVT
jgi:transposase InsO family protein